MAEHFSIPSREEAERFSEAYLAAQQDYYESLEEGGLTMANDYISREAVLALETDLHFDGIEQLKYWRCHHIDPTEVEILPAADVVEVVRCKDCIHARDSDCPINWPKNWEDYCSFGERRADNG